MNLVDSSLWIDFFGYGKYADIIEDVLIDFDNLIVPTIIIAEVFKWIMRERNENDALLAISVTKSGFVIELTEQIAINSSYYGIKYKLPMADSIIYATAQVYSAQIFTCDKHFSTLPSVNYFNN